MLSWPDAKGIILTFSSFLLVVVVVVVFLRFIYFIYMSELKPVNPRHGLCVQKLALRKARGCRGIPDTQCSASWLIDFLLAYAHA